MMLLILHSLQLHFLALDCPLSRVILEGESQSKGEHRLRNGAFYGKDTADLKRCRIMGFEDVI